MAAATTVKVNDATELGAGPARAASSTAAGRRRCATGCSTRACRRSARARPTSVSGSCCSVSAGAIASGAFDVGTLALFVSYLGWLAFLPRMVGRVLARRKQAGIAFDRMRRLVADADAGNTVRPRSLPLEGWQSGTRPADVRPARVPLERFEVRRLTARYPGGAGVVDVSFTIERGEFVVVTGADRVRQDDAAAGRARASRGRPTCSGVVAWNGDVLTDRAAFLVPPNAAFLPQVPQLVSDSVRDNVGLGDVADDSLARALALAAVDDDIARMPAGDGTLIGPRGLRLSGGQRQRLATARALVHVPELVVLDDLSSAVDVETELQLWQNLADAGLTVLAVSHRAVAFERASQVLHLDAGRLRA